MTKDEFLALLQARLGGLPQADRDKALEYYTEMIDERMEDGLSEAEAIAAIGPIEEAVANTLDGVSLPRLICEKVKPQRSLKGWEICLLILGFPLWFSLLITLVSVIFALYLTLWSLVAALGAVTLAIGACSLACLAAAIVPSLSPWAAPLLLSCALALIGAGLSILLFHLCRLCSKGVIWLGKRFVMVIKSLFIHERSSK